jgi:hypothetical protein
MFPPDSPASERCQVTRPNHRISRALGCLNLDRREFAAQLQRRGWTYHPKTHVWSRTESADAQRAELALFPE